MTEIINASVGGLRGPGLTDADKEIFEDAAVIAEKVAALTGFLPVEMSPDSGYSYALIDGLNRAALLITLDGTVIVPKLSIKLTNGTYSLVTDALALAPQAGELGPDADVAFALADDGERSALMVKRDGSIAARIDYPSLRWNRPDDQAPYPALGSPNMVGWGDSLSETGTGGNWQGALEATYPGRSVEPRGLGGQVSTMIAARADAIPVTVTVANNRLNASGSTPLTAVTPDLLAHVNDQSTDAAIVVGNQWVNGILHRAPGGAYDFARTTPGAVIAVPPGSRLRPLINPLDQRINIIRLGQNDVGNQVANAQALVLANCAAIVRRLVSHQRRFLVVGLHMGAGEVAGGPTRVMKEAINTEWKRLYGDRFVDINWFLINRGLAAAGLAPTAQDNADIAAGIVPSSLRADDVHFNTYGGLANGAGLTEAIERNGS